MMRSSSLLIVATALSSSLIGASAAPAQDITADGPPMPDVDTSALDAPDDGPVVPAPDAADGPAPAGAVASPETPPVVDNPARGFTAYTEGLTWSPVVAPLNLAVVPTSQAWFDSYIPFTGDEGGAFGLWLGYQGAGVAGLATMGATAATNALFTLSPEVLATALAAGGFNDRAPLAVGNALAGLYGRIGAVSLAVGGSGALESVPVAGSDGVLEPFALGGGLGVGAELGVALWDDGLLVARTTVSQVGAFDAAGERLMKIDPTLGLMVQVFGTPLVLAVGASVVAPDGRDPIVAPRIFFGGGFDDEPRHEAPALPGVDDDPATATLDTGT